MMDKSPAYYDKLLLPLPDQLDSPDHQAPIVPPDIAPLAHFIKSNLVDREAIQDWLKCQFEEQDDLFHTPSADVLTERQQAYDDYFYVARQTGGNKIIPLALGQVLAEVSREFESGVDLSETDTARFMDGLMAVLELANER